MKKIIATIILLVTLQHIWGQEKGLSLDEAIETALNNRYELKIEKKNTSISANEVEKIKSRNRPQITSDFDWRYYTQLQTSMLPIGAITNDPNAPETKAVLMGTDFNTTLGFSINQSVFNPVNAGDKEIAKAQIGYNQLAEKVSENQIKEEVTESYLTALIWSEKVKVSTTNVNRSNAIYNTGIEQLKNGSITNYELKRFEIDFENAKAENVKNINSFNLALTELSYRMGIERVGLPVLSDDMERLLSEFTTIGIEASESKRPELQMEKQQQEIYQLQIKKQNLSYMPTVSVSGNYTLQFLNNHFKPFKSEYWFPYNYFGLKVSIPVFDGLQKEKVKNEYLLRCESSALIFEKLKRDYNQNAKSAISKLQNALTDMDYQKKNLEMVKYLYSVEKDKLDKGTITLNDLSNTHYTVQQTQNHYLDAVYNYLVAVVRYKKAIGNF